MEISIYQKFDVVKKLILVTLLTTCLITKLTAVNVAISLVLNYSALVLLIIVLVVHLALYTDELYWQKEKKNDAQKMSLSLTPLAILILTSIFFFFPNNPLFILALFFFCLASSYLAMQSNVNNNISKTYAISLFLTSFAIPMNFFVINYVYYNTYLSIINISLLSASLFFLLWSNVLSFKACQKKCANFSIS